MTGVVHLMKDAELKTVVTFQTEDTSPQRHCPFPVGFARVKSLNEQNDMTEARCVSVDVCRMDDASRLMLSSGSV